MLHYIFLLLLINASYRSLGNPVSPSAPISLANSLTELAGHCSNAFLSQQIKSKISYCTDLSSPHGEKQLQCLIFYDINKQLCSAVDSGKLALPEENLMDVINEAQDVNSICLVAKEWIFSNLTEFPRYKPALDKVFKHPVSCGKYCGVEDFMSDEANFFCKYFKWGSDILKHQVTITSTQEHAANNAQLPSATSNVVGKPIGSAPELSDLQDVQIKSSSNKPKSNGPTIKPEVLAKIDIPKSETTSVALNVNNQPSELASPANVVALPDNIEEGDINNNEDIGAISGNDLTGDKPPSQSSGSVIPQAEKADIPEVSQNKPEDVLKTDTDKELQKNSSVDKKGINNVVDDSKAKKVDDIDYQGIDDKDGLSDMQGGDDEGEEQMLNDFNPKPEDIPKKIENVVSTYNRDQDFYVSPVQDGFPKSDDHFFPFFLTAIILVVLLYVLYHNKNKVGKVFFGLVLEGRQGGRRRNSRGHSYRRLDTLEQAMSAKTDAPPSKIIY